MSRLAVLVMAGALCAVGGSASAQSFEATCPNVQYRGPIIVASCYNVYGGLSRTSIDARACGGQIANVNGQLQCRGGRRGYDGPGRGYGGPPPGYGGGFGGQRYGY